MTPDPIPAGPRLTFVLATGPAVGDLARIVALARAAQRRHVPTALFAMHHGVTTLAAAPALVAALHDADCDVVGCATSADQLGVELATLAAAGVAIGSQDDHARLVDGARVVAFT